MFLLLVVGHERHVNMFVVFFQLAPNFTEAAHIDLFVPVLKSSVVFSWHVTGKHTGANGVWPRALNISS